MANQSGSQIVTGTSVPARRGTDSVGFEAFEVIEMFPLALVAVFALNTTLKFAL